MADRKGLDPMTQASLQRARRHIQQLEEELERTSRGITALTLDLEEAQERFQLLVENVQVSFRLMSFDGRELLYMSPTTRRVWGLEPREIGSEPGRLLAVVHPDDRALVERQLFHPDTEVPQRKFRVVEEEGAAPRWVRDVVYRIGGEDGSPGYLAGITEDVTEEEEIRRQLVESEERHRALMQQNPDAVFGLAPTGIVDEVNDECCALVGRDADEVLDRPFTDHFPEEQKGRVEVRLDEVVVDRMPRKFFGSVVTAEGIHREVEVTALPIDLFGEVAGIYAVVRDLTEQLEMERQFLQAQKMDQIGRLAGGVAHDFNNFLTVIGGNAELALQDLGEDEPARSDLIQIRQTTRKAAALAQQLLAFSRRQVLQTKPVVIDDLVAGMENMFARLLGDHIEVATHLRVPDVRVELDPSQMEQVVMNLAVNARDAMPDGGRLTVETEEVDLHEESVAGPVSVPPGRYVLLRVRDTGIGMDRLTRDKIFEPFFTTKEAGKGTGLGLSTVHGIVKQSRGHILVYSEPGRGTDIKMFFPRAGEAGSAPAAPPPGSEAPSRGGSARILIVEDEDAVRSVMRRILEASGYTVRETGSGEEAMDVLREFGGELDLVICDFFLGTGTGSGFVKDLRELHEDMKVLFISGYAADSLPEPIVRDAVSAFLGKPFTPSSLLRKVREILEGRTVEG